MWSYEPPFNPEPLTAAMLGAIPKSDFKGLGNISWSRPMEDLFAGSVREVLDGSSMTPLRGMSLSRPSTRRELIDLSDNDADDAEDDDDDEPFDNKSAILATQENHEEMKQKGMHIVLYGHANTEEFNKEISEHVARKTNAYPGGATMPDLCDTHGEDMTKLIEAAVLCSGQTQLRWYADKVAEFHLTFEKSEYAIAALATSLVHLPLHCVPLGSDDFQRIRPSLMNRNEDETEIIVVDKGSSINVATDLPDLVSAIREIFTQAGLGEEGEHLKQLPATTVRPGTDPEKPGTYMRMRVTRGGNLFTGLASEAAYEWLGKQDRHTVRFSLPSKNRFYLLQHSDFSRTADKFKGKRRQAAPSAWGTGQTEAVVQALEDKLTCQWANVVKGGAAGDEEILKLRNAVEKLEDTCKNGFTESVQATNQVSSKVDGVNASVIDLTEETRSFNTKHLGIASDILESFSNSNKALAKLLKSHRTPEPAKKVLRRPREATSDSEPNMEIDEDTRAEFRRLQRAREKSDERKKLEEPRSSRSQRTRT
ncbi:hypothetical protein CYMTET_11133 [Cymbomonas tetramitiformis]|uniref:Uncharacterized protein n=1 Tax=Cymbomonas tetramitiformis TaxID=36881 RepID=A0AAE0GMX7_9CHLO|nr:hypothetical protein CYMTET_11133 [Cymbomonas tetramitiformis]